MLRLNGSAPVETRVLTIIGAVVVLCCVMEVGLYVVNPLGGRAGDRLLVVFDTPYVVQGILPGTSVVMHGVEVGKVTSVSSLPSGGVRLSQPCGRKMCHRRIEIIKIIEN